jgi:hypothetical protein
MRAQSRRPPSPAHEAAQVNLPPWQGKQTRDFFAFSNFNTNVRRIVMDLGRVQLVAAVAACSWRDDHGGVVKHHCPRWPGLRGQVQAQKNPQFGIIAPTDTQRIPNGYPTDQQARNTGAVPEQTPSSAGRDDSGLAQKLGHRHFKAFEQARPGPLAGMPAANHLAGPGFPVPDFDRSGFGINQPVFPHAGRRVKIALVNAVAPARTRRADRDNHIDGSEFALRAPARSERCAGECQ